MQKGVDLMAKQQEYTCVSYIRGADGALVEFSTLSQAQKQDVRERIAENVGKIVGEFLSSHSEEIEPFCRCNGVEILKGV